MESLDRYASKALSSGRNRFLMAKAYHHNGKSVMRFELRCQIPEKVPL
jgi:hypothetical protein